MAMADKAEEHSGWVIMYGDLLDGITCNQQLARKARAEGASIYPIAWTGAEIPMDAIRRAIHEATDDARNI